MYAAHVQRCAFLLSVVLAGCAPVYIAPAANAPLLEKAGELQVAGQLGTNGIDGQIAFSPVNSLGLVAAASGVSGENDKHFYGEIGVGYYVPRLRSDAFRAEVIGGVGYGFSRGYEDFGLFDGDGDRLASGRYLRGFLQGDVGASSDNVDAGLALRVALVSYDYEDLPSPDTDDNETNTFIEPLGFLRFGADPIKFETQFGFVIPFYEHGPQTIVVHFSIGLRLTFDLFPEQPQQQPQPQPTQPQPIPQPVQQQPVQQTPPPPPPATTPPPPPQYGVPVPGPAPGAVPGPAPNNPTPPIPPPPPP